MSSRPVTLRAQLGIFVAVALCGSALSALAFQRELEACSAGPRDLGFFMTQYEHLLDVPVWRALAVQPSGNDAFGFAGLDGAPTLHVDIHVSPLKYLLAAVHVATDSWLAVHLTLVLIVLSGLTYALVRLEREGAREPVPLAALGLLACSPLFLYGTCHDLRPFVALAPFVAALTAALLTRAPSRHVIVLSCLGLLVREEAAVLVALASLWLALDGRRDDAWRTFSIAGAYLVGFHALYFGFLPFEYTPHAGTAAVWLAFFAPAVWLLAPSRWTEPLARAHARHRALTVLVLGLPFAAVLIDPYFGGHLMRSAMARTFPAVLVVVVAASYAVATSVEARKQRGLTTALALALIPALGASLVTIGGVRAEAAPGCAVWTLAEGLPPETPVLTDFLHYQAFAGRNRLLVWERLPVELEAPDGPEAPEDRPALLRAVRETDALWVMSPASFESLVAALHAESAGALIERCDGPSSFVIAHRRGGRVACPSP